MAAAQRRQLFIDLAQPWARDEVLVVDVYAEPYPRLPRTGGASRGAGPIAWLMVLIWTRRTSFLLAVTPTALHILRAKAGWKGWRVTRRLGSWPRTELKVTQDGEYNLRIEPPGEEPITVMPRWSTLEAAEIARLLRAPGAPR